MATPEALDGPAPCMIAHCPSCEAQREFDPVATRSIQARDHKFAVVYRCRTCKTIEVRMFRKYVTPKRTILSPPSVGLGWL
jgi:hypothetical protein